MESVASFASGTALNLHPSSTSLPPNTGQLRVANWWQSVTLAHYRNYCCAAGHHHPPNTSWRPPHCHIVPPYHCLPHSYKATTLVPGLPKHCPIPQNPNLMPGAGLQMIMFSPRQDQPHGRFKTTATRPFCPNFQVDWGRLHVKIYQGNNNNIDWTIRYMIQWLYGSYTS